VGGPSWYEQPEKSWKANWQPSDRSVDKEPQEMLSEKNKLEKEIKNLEEQLKDREAALPAHSVRPHQLQIIEDLEEKIQEKKRELEKLGDA